MGIEDIKCKEYVELVGKHRRQLEYACMFNFLQLFEQVYRMPVSEGDIVIAATDGVLDNANPDQIKPNVLVPFSNGDGPEAAAEQIAFLASHLSSEEHRRNPFYRSALWDGYRHYGGKRDDMTVIVSYITSSSS